MPFTCHVAFDNTPNIIALLEKVPYLAKALANTGPLKGTSETIDVFEMAIIENIYGKLHAVAPEDAAFLQAYEQIEIAKSGLIWWHTPLSLLLEGILWTFA